MPKQLHLSQRTTRYLRWTVVLNAVLKAGIDIGDLLMEILIAQKPQQLTYNNDMWMRHRCNVAD